MHLLRPGRKTRRCLRGAFHIPDTLESVALCNTPLQIIELLVRDPALVIVAILFVSEH